jgi:hypothetical protein
VSRVVSSGPGTALTYRVASLMVAASQMTALNRPGDSAFRSLDSFSMEEALCETENTWIAHKEDLVTLKPGREHAWLDDGIEHILKALHCSAIEWVFCSAVSTLPNTRR